MKDWSLSHPTDRRWGKVAVTDGEICNDTTDVQTSRARDYVWRHTIDHLKSWGEAEVRLLRN